jgi:hypothetical protein
VLVGLLGSQKNLMEQALVGRQVEGWEQGAEVWASLEQRLLEGIAEH